MRILAAIFSVIERRVRSFSVLKRDGLVLKFFTVNFGDYLKGKGRGKERKGEKRIRLDTWR